MYERVASKCGRTAADRVVIEHLATSGDAARAQTGVAAFHVDAGLVQRAVGIDYTLGPTGWRASYESGYARADRLVVKGLAATVRAAGRWTARVFDHEICKGVCVFSHGTNTRQRYRVDKMLIPDS